MRLVEIFHQMFMDFPRGLEDRKNIDKAKKFGFEGLIFQCVGNQLFGPQRIGPMGAGSGQEFAAELLGARFKVRSGSLRAWFRAGKHVDHPMAAGHIHIVGGQ